MRKYISLSKQRIIKEMNTQIDLYISLIEKKLV